MQWACAPQAPFPSGALSRQARAEALARKLPATAALLSITVPANHTMRRLFARRGLVQQRRVVAWPATPVAQEAHERMAAAAAAKLQEQPEQPRQQLQDRQQQQQQRGSAPALSFLQALPAVAAAADTPAARALLPRWRRCASVAELEVALLRLRQADPQRQQQHGDEGEEEAGAAALGAVAAAAPPAAGRTGTATVAAARTAGASAAHEAAPAAGTAAAGSQAVGAVPAAALPTTSCAFNWLPAEYELLPAGGAAAQQLVQQGAVWLLEPPVPARSDGPAAAQLQAEASGGVHAAVLACMGPGFRSMRHAGIVAGSPAALESALLHASAVADPRCCRCGLAGGLTPPMLWHCGCLAFTASVAWRSRSARVRLHALPWLPPCCSRCLLLLCPMVAASSRFYIDACGFDHPRLWASTGGPRTDILPFCKPLAACHAPAAAPCNTCM